MISHVDFDILIVGGGPAAAACATLIARGGARVAIVEAGDFTRFRIGETVEPSIRPLLKRLGMQIEDDCGWATSSPGVTSVWGRPKAELRPSIVTPYGRGWRLERRLFDRALFEHAGASGAELYPGSRARGVSRRKGRWEFTIISRGRTVHARAPLVVEATGRNGASKFSPSKSRLWFDRLVGIAIFRQGGPAISGPQAALVEAGPCGWWYSVRLPGGRELAVFFTDVDLLPRRKAHVGEFLEQQLRETEFTRDLRGLTPKEPESITWRAFDARTSIPRIAATDGWVAVGDALMAFDPLSGRGVTEALSSGIRLADWLLNQHSEMAGRMPGWVEQASAHFNDYLRQRLRTYMGEGRWSHLPFWRRRQSNPSIFY